MRRYYDFGYLKAWRWIALPGLVLIIAGVGYLYFSGQIGKKLTELTPFVEILTFPSHAIASEEVKEPMSEIKEKKKVNMDSNLKKRLNTFFSNFSEVYLKPFTKDKIDNKELIRFGVWHNYINRFDRFKFVGNEVQLEAVYVERAVEKYFGRKIKEHQSVPPEINYKNGYYYMQGVDSKVQTFSQVVELVDIGNDLFVASVDVYVAENSWKGDPHGTPEQWERERENLGNPPHRIARMTATIKKIISEGKERYVLLEYLKIADYENKRLVESKDVSYEEPLLIGLVDCEALKPLFLYKNKKYRNFEEEFKTFLDKKENEYRFVDPNKVRNVLEEFQKTKFFLYLEGRLVGEFKGTSLKMDVDSPFIEGEVFWKVPEGEKETEEKELAIALNQPIKQPFWPKVTLSSHQSQELKKTISLNFSAAFQKLKVSSKHFSKNKVAWEKVKIMDLEQDGQPEVFVNIVRRPDTRISGDVGISLLLSWQNNQWSSLLYGYYKWSEIAEGIDKEIGEGFITNLWPVDTNGDEIADVIISEVPDEDIILKYYLYQIQKGEIKKILYLGTWWE